MNRGDRREPIFADNEDRQRLLETLAQACQKTGWQVHAYCLMRNHFHLVIETPQPNLVAGMKWLLGTYTSRYNRRHNGEAVQEAEAAQGERLVVQGLKRLGWSEADPAGAAQRRAQEGRVGPGTTREDDDAVGLDRGAAEHGQPRASGVVAATVRSKPARRTHRPRPPENMTISLTL